MNIYAIQWMRMPSLLGTCRFGLFGLLVVFLLSGPIFAQAQQAEPTLAVTVQEREDLAAVMADEAARERLLSRIRSLIATREDTQVTPPVESAGARLIAALSENVRETGRQLGPQPMRLGMCREFSPGSGTRWQIRIPGSGGSS